MGITGGMKCLKYLLFFFNVIFLLCGITLMVVGALTQVALFSTLMIKSSIASGGPITIIGVGAMVFLIAFFGCCGAWKESYCMVTMFAILLSLIIFVEIAAAITGYIFRQKVSEVVHESLTTVFSQYNSVQPQFRDYLDKLQISLSCCGVNSSSDWVQHKPDNNSVPDSCCKTKTTDCGVGAMTDANKVNEKGCQGALVEFLKNNSMWVIVSVLVIAMLQVMGLVFACLLMRGIRSGYEVM
ncbi:putative CD63 antigen isoform 5 [Scophthalmus maximus]|uniref:Tetraspanin n=1 Tax=Scophthalmus maximus TaxID=52904 RepID=A0A2U9C1G4_SCOMX|nr:putative CD63 antigen [Scophthalmus maximus]AWP10207.1 putative CD63 antigen isoform 2 [Scophthalmus maximus]AWP10208.1 putative CD63 antigen isoform 3 [Scophthalmus maximus]AWP10209.1 putative CD63 antigen isoform 4 [Scophthalmus maximus]AWP10210.1 putative CD63 antigen isoform 5 [Scophthalmus maximus]